MLLQDLRYAFRALFRTPVFTAIAVLCLSLGIGVNTMIFGVVDGVLVQSLPYQDAERLVVVQETFHRGNIRESGLSYKNMLDWKERNTVFTTVAGVQYRSLVLADGGGEPDRAPAHQSPGICFAMLGWHAAHGRTFTAEDDRPGAEPVVILGDEIFQRRYRGDPSDRRTPRPRQRASAHGRRRHAAELRVPENQKLYTPLAPFAHDRPRTERGLFTLARLKDGVTIEQARGELTAIAAQLAKESPRGQRRLERRRAAAPRGVHSRRRRARSSGR